MKKLLFLCATLFATTAFAQAGASDPQIASMDLQWSADTSVSATFGITGNFPVTVTFAVSKESGAQEKLLETSFTYANEGFKQVFLKGIGTQDKDFRLLVAISDSTGNYRIYGYSITNSPFAAAPTGITDVDQKSISVFPNPFSNTLSITTQETQGGLRITDVTGREIYRSELHSGSNSVATEEIPTGIYIATLTDSKGLIKETKKIFKE